MRSLIGKANAQRHLNFRPGRFPCLTVRAYCSQVRCFVGDEFGDRNGSLNRWMAALVRLAVLSAACSETAASPGSADGEGSGQDEMGAGSESDHGSDGNTVNPPGPADGEQATARDAGHDDDVRMDAGSNGDGGSGPDPATLLFMEDFE